MNRWSMSTSTLTTRTTNTRTIRPPQPGNRTYTGIGTASWSTIIRTSRTFTTGTTIERRLLRLVNAEFRFLGAADGDCEVEAIQAWGKVRGSGTGSGGEYRQRFVGVWGGLLDGVEEAFAAGEVKAFAGGVVEKVVGVTGDGQVGNGFAVGGVEHDQARGFAAADE